MVKKINISGWLNKDLTGCDFKNGLVLKNKIRHLKGRELIISITPEINLRSINQNNWLWGVAYEYIQNWHLQCTGEVMSLNEIHLINMVRIQKVKVDLKIINNKEQFSFGRHSSSKWSTEEFNYRAQKLQAYFAYKGLIIPDPKKINTVNYFLTI